MKYLISLALASTMLAGVSAHAADIDPAPVVEEAHDWRGGYFGIQGGGVFGSNVTASTPIVAPFDFVTGTNLDGVHGGIFGGYNFQSGNVVFGIDNDFSFTSSDTILDGGPATADLRTLSSVRGRVGYAFDRVLPYVTGGLAYGNVRVNLPGFGSESEFQFGWTVGAGVEAALTDYVSARVQYTYSDLGSDGFLPDVFGGVNVDLGGIHAIRAGVSIKTAPLWNKVFGR
ncbi:MAG: outer membrane protein [Hyphomicrobiales bacterium]